MIAPSPDRTVWRHVSVFGDLPNCITIGRIGSGFSLHVFAEDYAIQLVDTRFHIDKQLSFRRGE